MTDNPLPRYVVTAAKHSGATHVAQLPGCYQLMTEAQAVEYVDNAAQLGQDVAQDIREIELLGA